MKVRIVCTADFELDPKWIDADGTLNHISDPKQVGGATAIKPEHRKPVLDALVHLLHKPYYVAGSTPQRTRGWTIIAKEVK
jgi:hypothetical protein